MHSSDERTHREKEVGNYPVLKITMTEIEQIQTIIIAKAIYALTSVARTVRKYKCHKRALNKIERTTTQTLYEIELVKERLYAAQQVCMRTIE